MNRYATNHKAADSWIEFTLSSLIDTIRYRTTPDVSIVQFWSEHRVPGLARPGWNTTKSATVQVHARAAIARARA